MAHCLQAFRIQTPVVLTGRHWENDWLIGPGMALNPEKYFIIVPNMFGNGLSSSPRNTPAPLDGPRFPEVCQPCHALQLITCPPMYVVSCIAASSNCVGDYEPLKLGLQIRVQDNVNAQHQLVTKKLGITSLVAVLGWSMGAGQTFQWAVRSAPCTWHASTLQRHGSVIMFSAAPFC